MSILSPSKKYLEKLDREAEAERRQARERWPSEDAKVAALAEQGTPLNDLFQKGYPVHPAALMRYICALERRVRELEENR